MKLSFSSVAHILVAVVIMAASLFPLLTLAVYQIPASNNENLTTCTQSPQCVRGPNGQPGTCETVFSPSMNRELKVCAQCTGDTCTFGSYTVDVPVVPVVTTPRPAADVPFQQCNPLCRDGLVCTQRGGLDSSGQYTLPLCMSSSAHPYTPGAPGINPGPPQAAPAVQGPPAEGSTLINFLSVDSLPELMSAILAAGVRVGSILLVLALIWIGFLFVQAQGSEEKIRDARSGLVWVVVGGLLLLGAQALSLVIQSTVNAL